MRHRDPRSGCFLAFLVWGAAACATSGGAASGEDESGSAARRSERPREATTSFAIIGLPCRSAGATLESWVRSDPAVSRARFDERSVTLTVVHDSRRLDRSALEELIETRGVRVMRDGQRGSIRPPVLFPSELDVVGLPEVHEDDIEDHLVRGKVTVFHFRAPSGEVCSDIDLALVVLMQSRDDIALRRLPSSGVPEVIVYAATAHRFGPFAESDVEAIEAAILEAAGGDMLRIGR